MSLGAVPDFILLILHLFQEFDWNCFYLAHTWTSPYSISRTVLGHHVTLALIGIWKKSVNTSFFKNMSAYLFMIHTKKVFHFLTHSPMVQISVGAVGLHWTRVRNSTGCQGPTYSSSQNVHQWEVEAGSVADTRTQMLWWGFVHHSSIRLFFPKYWKNKHWIFFLIFRNLNLLEKRDREWNRLTEGFYLLGQHLNAHNSLGQARPKLGTWNLEPGVRGLEPGTWSH